MKKAPIPQNEKERLVALHSLAIANTEPEERFDKLTKEATEKFNVPISTISIITSDKELYKSCQGLDVREGGRDVSFCGHALLASSIFIVEDTLKNEYFADNPTVVGAPFIRFYAGIALREQKTGLPIGVFCIKDIKPRKMSTDDVSLLMEFASKAEEELNKKQ